MELYEHTAIWKRTLAEQTNDSHKDQRERLRNAFKRFRSNAKTLVGLIQSTLPDLTIHDISHLDALWETGSTISGNDFSLNPLEAFIFGGAILLHDSALCYEAYNGGKGGLRNTSMWKDTYALLLNEKGTSDQGSELLKKEADFQALRGLHAERAKELYNKQWEIPNEEGSIYLIEDRDLRRHYGQLIGKIAASHHWSIERLLLELDPQVNPIGDFPIEWTIDPIKIACLLRCSDAAHIDSNRAPDFLYALLQRAGVSSEHWKSQNRLAKATLDQSDNEALLITSNINFSESDSESWFVAYDAACLINKELESSNKILKDKNGFCFQANKVKGVMTPEAFSNYVKTINWQPYSAKVHVGNVENLIESLGGEMLYGKNSGANSLSIVIRELIQNSRDAIKAREKSEQGFKGEVIIGIESNDEEEWLVVDDNGIGMSERVLLGPLLDFGTSFWASEIVKEEFPGLASSGFKSVGQFGIGFYSVFMIANEVHLSSRNWNKGLDDFRKLQFKNGFSLRPILTKGNTDNLGTFISTRTKLLLKPDSIPKDMMIEIKSGKMGEPNFNIGFKKLISIICAGLDVDVKHTDGDLLHQNILASDFDKSKWLNDISCIEEREDDRTKQYIESNLNRLKPIYDNNRLIGLAAISTTVNGKNDYLSINTVGGLSSNSLSGRNGQYFIGFMDYEPKSAKRDFLHDTKNPEITKWALEQKKELEKMNLDPTICCWVSNALCRFGVDPSSLVYNIVGIDNEDKKSFFQLSIDQLVDLSLQMPITFIYSDLTEHIDINHKIITLPGKAVIRPIINGSFYSLKIIDNKPINNYSLLDCIYRAIESKGLKPLISRENNIGVNVFSQKVHGLNISSKRSE